MPSIRRVAYVFLTPAVLIAALALSACQKQEPPAAAKPETTGNVTETKPIDAVGTSTVLPAAAPVQAPQTDFDPTSVPVSTATLPPFPFFKTPEGLVSIFNNKDRNLGFNREYFIAGKKLLAVEGKLFRDSMNLTNADTKRTYSELEFQRNYENAITALGGQKISATAFTDELLTQAGGRDAFEKFWHSAAPVPDYLHSSYLLRSPQKEYWIHVSTGSIPVHGFVTVLESEGMKQSVGFLDASAMKKALDADGRVALYINFDTDKASLRPDAQPIIDQIHKLLTLDPALKLSVEGHTDSTGAADHNRQLSTARARSVMGALVGLGVDAGRLASKGFGPDKPIAPDTDDAGRAKNRRVELVKVR